MKRTEPEATLAGSMEELQRKTQMHCDSWGLGTSARWDSDQDSGEIAFSFSNGVVVTAPMQIVGSYDVDEGTWLWAWANPSVDVELTEHALLARSFGERHNLREFATAKFTCSETDAWQFVAVACRLGNATGAYRGPAGSTHVYFTFGETTFHRSN